MLFLCFLRIVEVTACFPVKASTNLPLVEKLCLQKTYWVVSEISETVHAPEGTCIIAANQRGLTGLVSSNQRRADRKVIHRAQGQIAIPAAAAAEFR